MKLGIRAAVVLLSYALLVPALAGERVDFGLDNYREVEIAAYSRAVKLPPLDVAGGDQIRVWFMGYWSGHMPINGYVLTPKAAFNCKLSYNNDNGKYMVINSGHCRGPSHHSERLAAGMAVLPELAKLDGQTIQCGVMDGGGASVEGVYEEKRFRFDAQNVEECQGESFRKVGEMLDLLAGAYYAKD